MFGLHVGVGSADEYTDIGLRDVSSPNLECPEVVEDQNCYWLPCETKNNPEKTVAELGVVFGPVPLG